MKQLEKKDLIIGEIYKHENGNLVKYQFDGNINGKIRGSYIGNNANRFYKEPNSNFTISSLKLATPEEKHWLEVCIAANSFISYDEAMKTFIPEYVECIKQLPGITIGKILHVENNIVIDGEFNNYSMTANDIYDYFKPSTKEAYDTQFVVKEPEFVLPEKWWVRITKENLEDVCKFLGFEPYEKAVGYIAGMVKDYRTGKIEKSWNTTPTTIYGSTFGNEITLEQFKKYVLKENTIVTEKPKVVLEEPKDKVLTKALDNQIIQVESSEGAIFKLGDKIKVFTHNSPNKGKVFTIKGFRWNNAKTNLCAITELHTPNGIGLDKIELYSKPVIKELSLLEQAKLKYPIGTKVKSMISGKIVEIKKDSFQFSSSKEMLSYDYGVVLLFDSKKWAEIVDDFKLPETWWIIIENQRQFEIAKQYFSQFMNDLSYLKIKSTIGYFPNRNNMKYTYNLANETKQDNPQITFEQFEQYVLHNGFKIGDRFSKQKYLYNSGITEVGEREITDLQYINNESVAFHKVIETCHSGPQCRILTKNIVR